MVLCGMLSVSPQIAAAAEIAPEQVIRDFYRWYVEAVASNRDPLTEKRAELKRYATARLLGEIDGMVKGPEGLNGDYFLDAQDIDKDWAKNIKVSTPAIRGNRATADVELTGKELGMRQLRVSLAREKGSWKVDKVTGKQ